MDDLTIDEDKETDLDGYDDEDENEGEDDIFDNSDSVIDDDIDSY